ncbi:spore germination protein [Paenibacillus montanisoli]|uniref:Spore germination protein n=1 Tax=Paenibacillus montanisoli TaxID=2081970 RepID=A0A328U4Y2_9BACL|nr:spore germination protein [Paenibacillus montanisoli]RAP77660.1 spore germination protein [Paenibacillus montanisoli]
MTSAQEITPPMLARTLHEFEDCCDLVHRVMPGHGIDLLYFGNLISGDRLNRDLLSLIETSDQEQLDRFFRQSQFVRMTDSKELVLGILAGHAAFFYKGAAYTVDVAGDEGRSVTPSEVETTITGPHDAFTEQASVSLAMIRKRIKSPHLKVIRLSVGEVTKADVFVLYIKDIANMDYVNELKKRIADIEVDAVLDTNMLIQLIDDNAYALFPQMLTSERPDAIASKLVAGRVVGMMDGSPTAFSIPASFVEFFSSSDDYYMRWLIGSSTRILRFIALFITVIFTALYVSVTTYHYEMIPQNLILTLAESRSRVPFPPVYEALIMELTIELLREAGARLPSKIGQTIGIVGGIVIGQAAVQAGLTSNILIIAVASSTIASFVIPNYTMSASIRLIRFGLILLAGLWGNMGLAMGLAAVIIHLCGMTSFGSSYVTPLAPNQPAEWKDVFIRAPFSKLKYRPTQQRTKNRLRSQMKR